jgi:hypothetical protein
LVVSERNQTPFSSFVDFKRRVLDKLTDEKQKYLIKALLDSNTHIRTTNPDSDLETPFEYGIDKTDLQNWTTEISFSSGGLWEIDVSSKITTGNTTIENSRSLLCSIYDVLKHSTQYDFELDRENRNDYSIISVPNKLLNPTNPTADLSNPAFKCDGYLRLAFDDASIFPYNDYIAEDFHNMLAELLSNENFSKIGLLPDDTLKGKSCLEGNPFSTDGLFILPTITKNKLLIFQSQIDPSKPRYIGKNFQEPIPLEGTFSYAVRPSSYSDELEPLANYFHSFAINNGIYKNIKEGKSLFESPKAFAWQMPLHTTISTLTNTPPPYVLNTYIDIVYSNGIIPVSNTYFHYKANISILQPGKWNIVTLHYKVTAPGGESLYTKEITYSPYSNQATVTNGAVLQDLELNINGRNLPLETIVNNTVLPLTTPSPLIWKPEKPFMYDLSETPYKGALSIRPLLELYNPKSPFTLGPIVLRAGDIPFRLFRNNGMYKSSVNTNYRYSKLGTINWTCYYPSAMETNDIDTALNIKILTSDDKSISLTENGSRRIISASNENKHIGILADGQFSYVVEMNLPGDVCVNETPMLDDITITVLHSPRWLIYR